MIFAAEAARRTLPAAYPERVGPEPLTPEEFAAWRTRLGLTQEQIAHELGVTMTTVWRWEKERREIPRMARLALMQLERQLKRSRP